MGLLRTVGPTVQPMDVAEIKRHLEIEAGETYHDKYLGELRDSITEAVEQYTGRALLPQTWVLTLEKFPDSTCPILIPRPPLRAITTIKYYDDDGTQQTLSSSLYRIATNATPSKVEPAYNEVWPSTRNQTEAVEVTYTAGYDDAASVPSLIKHAIRITIADWFENRGEEQLPNAARMLIASLRTGMHSGAYEVTK